MKKYNVGIVGYGWAAGAHIVAINSTSLAQVTAVCSSRPLAAAALRARHGGEIKVHSTPRTLLADPEIHAVSICSLPNLHARQAIAAAAAGKHLIIEKPLALKPRDLRTVVQAVEKARVKTCVCFECRYSSQFLAIKAVLEAGLLGQVHYAEVDYFHGIGPWYGQFRWNTKRSNGGSSLLSAGCHALDALLLCMEGEVAAVSSFHTSSLNKDFKKYEYPTTSVTILKFKDGRVGKVTSCIDCLQPYYFHTHLVGSEGSLLDNKFHAAKLKTGKDKWSELAFKLLDSGDVSDHPYQTQFEAFFQALDQDREMPLTNLREAARSHAVIFAADQSAATGKPVRFMSSPVNFPRCAMGIVAHPDDIEFTMAGTLLLLRQAGWETHYLALASGNCGSVHDNAADTRRRRRAEAKEAARILGAHWHPSLTDDLEIFYQDSLLQALSAVIREVKPGTVLTHSPEDYMEDHTATSRLAVTAAFARGMPNAKTVPHRPAARFDTMVYHAMPHGLRDPLRRRIVPGAYVNTTAVHATKLAALAAHRSQQEWLRQSQGMNSYLRTMEELSLEVGRMSRRFQHAEGWRRHSHLGFSSEDADPLRDALGKNIVINKTYEKNLERAL